MLTGKAVKEDIYIYIKRKGEAMPWCAPVKNPKPESIFVALEKLNILWSSFLYKLNRGEFQELDLRWSEALTLDPKVFWSLGEKER